MRALWGVVLLAAVGTRGDAAPDDDPLIDPNPIAPEPEHRKPDHQVAIPAVPAFDVPAVNSDGSHTAREMRLRSKQLLDHEVTIKGVVTWAYDCVKANLTPGKTAKQVQNEIDQDPTICERAKFYLGDAASSRLETSLWIVDLPRVYNKMELTRIKKADRDAPDRCEPDEKDAKKKLCPPYKLGDQVEVTGTWKLSSAHSERNSDGLLVYARMKNLTQKWETPGYAPAAAKPSTPPPSRVWLTAPLPPIKAVTRTKIRASVWNAARTAANEAIRAYGQKQFETAIERYTMATTKWPDFGSAWYGLSAAYAQRKSWDKAADAAVRAVATDPKVAMYRLMAGRALYEKAIAQAREAQARRENKRPEDVDVDTGAINFEKPLVELRQALVIDPSLWRAHYLIGSIERAAGAFKEAASELSSALASEPTESAPWIALIELYRAWDYTEQALKVAEQGTAAIPDAASRSDLWFEVGITNDDKGLVDQAIAGYDHALTDRADNDKAKFGRGQAYFKKKDYAKAKRDLEDFVKSAAGSQAFFKEQASRMLMDIAAQTTR